MLSDGVPVDLVVTRNVRSTARAIAACAHARRHHRNGVQQDMAYDHLEIEARWQRYWDEHGTFRATRRSGRPKRYVLDMFPR